MLHCSAELHQLISKGVVNSPISQEVHQVIVQGLENSHDCVKQGIKVFVQPQDAS